MLLNFGIKGGFIYFAIIAFQFNLASHGCYLSSNEPSLIIIKPVPILVFGFLSKSFVNKSVKLDEIFVGNFKFYVLIFLKSSSLF